MTQQAHTHHNTLFLSPEDVASIIHQEGFAKTMQGMVEAIEQDFLRWSDFDKSARLASHSPDGVIELMPIADDKTFTFKYVNGHPKNTALGLSTVMAFGVLADVATGMPLLISELTLATAMRTAATSVMAARLLARPDSHVMALIGNGAQSEFQALAFHQLMGIDEIHLYDVDAEATAKLMHNLRANPHAKNLRLLACRDTQEAVRNADIVTTITAAKQNAVIIGANMLKPGTHLNAVGGDCPGKTEIHADVLHAAKVFVEYEPQTRIEGDLQQMPADFVVTELWQVLAGQKPARDNDAQITMFDSVGFALEDFSALRYLHARAQSLKLGQALPLIPMLADPKNLYQLIKPAASEAIPTATATVSGSATSRTAEAKQPVCA